jgi:antibiotic biosynthesis monooxygenase (ABM) superfamily enzyme
MTDQRITLVATITVRMDAKESFHAFEDAAAGNMSDYGGALERRIVIEVDASTFKEVHIVTFPGMETYLQYQNDPRLAQVRPLRQASVVATELLTGTDGPIFGPA